GRPKSGDFGYVASPCSFLVRALGSGASKNDHTGSDIESSRRVSAAPATTPCSGGVVAAPRALAGQQSRAGLPRRGCAGGAGVRSSLAVAVVAGAADGCLLGAVGLA